MKRAAVLLVSALAACAEGPGALVLTVDQLPPFVADTEILVAGSITRTPAKSTDMIVTVGGGAAPAADTVRTNRYEVRVRLTSNAANQLAITATDLTGSTSNSLNVTVRQDGQGPVITEATPADQTDNVGLINTVSLKFSEPVVFASGGGIVLSRQGATIQGSTTRSADSLTLTFTTTNSVALSPNAIYRVATSGVRDLAQNAVPSSAASCFVTTPTGAAAVSTFTDSANDTIYGAGTNPSLQEPNLLSARFAREGPFFSGVFRFTGPRAFGPNLLNQGHVILELDTDRDSTTGFWTYKDTLFYASATFGPNYATMFASGTKVEYLIDLEPFINDSAVVGRKAGAVSVFIDALFVPGTCGASIGFVLPFSLIGNDDGQMNAVGLGYAETTSPFAFLIDPMPIKGNMAVDVRAPTPAPIHAGAQYVAPSRTPRLVRLPTRRFPLR